MGGNGRENVGFGGVTRDSGGGGLSSIRREVDGGTWAIVGRRARYMAEECQKLAGV
jgi:hypothetical protein